MMIFYEHIIIIFVVVVLLLGLRACWLAGLVV
jgi:hypothetical protein